MYGVVVQNGSVFGLAASQLTKGLLLGPHSLGDVFAIQKANDIPGCFILGGGDCSDVAGFTH